MVTRQEIRRLGTFGAIVVLAWSMAMGRPAWAQDTVPVAGAQTAPAIDAKLSKLWDDFIHGIKVARPELVRSSGEAILDSGAPARDIYTLSTKENNVDTVLTRGARELKDASQVIEQIRRKIEEGYQAHRGDAAQIENSIAMLPKSLRAYEIGASRLAQSGEYAMPQIIQKLMDPCTPPSLAERIITVLPRIGKDAVRPLTAALESKDDRLLEIVADALGKIRYGDATPALKELVERKDILDRTRDIAMAAMIACGGKEAGGKPLATLLYNLAEKYYYQGASLRGEPNADIANVWYWREGLGLESKAVPKEIFGDIYAMRFSRQALKHDGNFYPAVSLWLAARIRKDIDLPTGATDPTAAPGQASSRLYALAGSAEYMQGVLNRALKDNATALALRAIGALARTAGAQSLVVPVEGGVQPLVAAMSNPNRDVRLLAALTLANAMPQKRFNGDETVMAVLNEALRQTGQKQALLVASDQAQRNVLKDALRTAGYEVIEQADADKAIAAARRANGVDLVVLGDSISAAGMVERLRNDSILSAVTVAISGSDEHLARLAKTDKKIVLVGKEGGSGGDVAEGIAAAGKLGEAAQPQDSSQWAVRAADAIALLGTTSNTVYDISKTVNALINTLSDKRQEVRMAAVKALAAINSKDAQQAVATLAIAGALEEKTRVEVFKLLDDSLRRFGNQLSEQQASGVVGVVTNEKEPTAIRDAAAEVLGAMNLPSDKIKSLILGSDQDG